MSDNGKDRIQLRVSPVLKTDFQNWCDKNKTKPSIYLRQKIEEALAQDDKAKIDMLEKEIKLLKNEIRRLKKSN